MSRYFQRNYTVILSYSEKMYRLAVQNIGKASLGVESQYARARPSKAMQSKKSLAGLF